MKKLIFLALAAAAVGSASAQVGVNLSVGINAPGVYGQVDIGALPPAALIAPQPVLFGPVVVGAPALYLYVPVGEQHNWRRYCSKYNACARPTYFVRDDWVRDRYSHEHPEWNRGRGPAAHGPAPRAEERRPGDKHERDTRE